MCLDRFLGNAQLPRDLLAGILVCPKRKHLPLRFRQALQDLRYVGIPLFLRINGLGVLLLEPVRFAEKHPFQIKALQRVIIRSGKLPFPARCRLAVHIRAAHISAERLEIINECLGILNVFQGPEKSQIDLLNAVVTHVFIRHLFAHDLPAERNRPLVNILEGRFIPVLYALYDRFPVDSVKW